MATNGGAIGYLVGEENRGLEYMFIMMNAARYAVGVQGISIAERAYQKAVEFSRDARAKPPCRRQHENQRAHHPPPRCTPHAHDHARLHRRLHAMATVAAAAYGRFTPPS
jgi:alkylation response protein AidB-like acyl-CoA dehydrogenase